MNIFRTQFVIIVIAFAVLVSAGVFAQSDELPSAITIESKVDRDKIYIGDLIKYSVIVKHKPDVKVETLPLGANLGMFEIRDYSVAEPRKEDGQIVEQTDYLISTFDTGEFEIPPLGIHYTVGEDTTVQELRTESIKIVVESLQPSEEGDIRDIKMPLEIPRSYRGLIFIIIISIVGSGVLGLGLYFFKRYKEGKSLIPVRAKPPRPPHEVALEELEKLVASDLLANGKVEEYYVTLSEIIRRYFEGRFFIIAMEMTTLQLLDNMRNANIEPEIIALTEEFLDSCDLVKFAKYIPTAQENEKTTQQAFDLINRTKLVMEEKTETTEEELESGDHVIESEALAETEATVEMAEENQEITGGEK